MIDRTRLPGTPEPMHRWEGFHGVTIAGDSWGDSEGPLVLLQHGGGQTRHAWKNTGRRIGDLGYHTVAMDARGHGDSDWAPDGAYGQNVMVEDLQCVIAALGGKRPALVGASMGGGVSLVAVGEDRIDATALVLVDIAPGIEASGAAKIQAFMDQRPEGFESLEDVANSISAYQPHRPRPATLSGLAKNVRLGSDGKYYWHWDPAYRAGRRDLDKRRTRLEACALKLKLPTLLVRGEFSDVLTEEGARRFLELCPHSEYANVSGAAHMVAGDENDAFARSAIDFLQRAVPIGGRPAQPPHELHPPPESPVTEIHDVP